MYTQNVAGGAKRWATALGGKRDSLTGAGQGIGWAVVLAFAREGAGVTFTTRTVIVVDGGQTL